MAERLRKSVGLFTGKVFKGQIFDETYEWHVESPAGLFAPLTIEVWFRCEEDMQITSPAPAPAFHRMFEAHVEEWLAEHWWLTLGFTDIEHLSEDLPPACIPVCIPYRRVRRDDNTQVPGEPDTTNAFRLSATAHVETFNWAGFRPVTVIVTKNNWTATLIEENARMAAAHTSEDDLAKNAQYSAAIEFGAAKAMAVIESKKLRLEKLQSTGTYECPHFTVKVERFGQDTEISWALRDGLENCHIQGYRKEGGFHPEIWAGTPQNGTLEVDSREKKGYVVQHLEIGRTYYYTFYIPVWNKPRSFMDVLVTPENSPAQGKYTEGFVRFQVRVPAQQTAELEDLAHQEQATAKRARILELRTDELERKRKVDVLERANAPKGKRDPVMEYIDRLRTMAEVHIRDRKMRESLRETRKVVRDSVMKDASFQTLPPEDQERILTYWDAKAEYIEEEVLANKG